MAAPYLIVGLAGDSNGMWGKYRLTDGTDNAGSRIFAMKQDTSIVVANEPLDNLGYSDADGQAGQIGSTVSLCRLLRNRGKLPSGYDILIVPHCWAGTAFAGFWATTGNRFALDGGGGDTIGFLAHLNAALATHASSRVWFFDWNHGENDGGQTQTQYQNNMIATWGEIRSTISTALRVPILVPGCPPNRQDPALGNSPNPGVIAAQMDVANYLENAHYIDVANLTAIDNSNGYVHFCAVNHRGGTNNAPGNLGEVVVNPLSERKYTALISSGWPTRLTWS